MSAQLDLFASDYLATDLGRTALRNFDLFGAEDSYSWRIAGRFRMMRLFVVFVSSFILFFSR